MNISSQPNAAAYTTNQMCLSPPLSRVQLIDSLSPPPTPGRERFPVHREPTPLFFPASASLIHNAPGKRTRTTCEDQEALERMKSRPVPVPTFKLSRRDRRRVDTVRQRIDFDIDMLPPLPFDFTASSPQAIISRLPSLSEKAGRDCSCNSHSTTPSYDSKVLERGLKPLIIKETFLTGGHAKLVPLRRSYVSKGTVQRRNSFTAKAA